MLRISKETIYRLIFDEENEFARGIFDCHKIGTGMFTEAYRYKDVVFLITDCDAMCKRVLADVTRSEEGFFHPHLPKVFPCGEYTATKDVFQTFYYNKLRSKEYPEAWKMFKTLCKLMKEANDATPFMGSSWARWPYVRDNFINLVEEKLKIQNLKEDILTLYTHMQNYQDMVFEIESARNYGVDKEGSLILLDVVVDVGAWKSKTNRKRAIN